MAYSPVFLVCNSAQTTQVLFEVRYDGKPFLRVSATPSMFQNVLQDWPLVDLNTWYYVIITRRGSTLYVNYATAGQSTTTLAQTVTGATVAVGTASDPNLMRLGAYTYGSRRYQGYVADCRLVSNEALDSTAVPDGQLGLTYLG